MSMEARKFGAKKLEDEVARLDRRFAELSKDLEALLPPGDEKDEAGRALLKAKDWAGLSLVRGYLRSVVPAT